MDDQDRHRDRSRLYFKERMNALLILASLAIYLVGTEAQTTLGPQCGGLVRLCYFILGVELT